MPDIDPVYRPRKPQDSQYYRCVENHFEDFERVCEERFTTKYGFLRAYVRQVIYRYLDCGILHNGFARGSVRTAAMNTSWHSLASAAISAPPVTRRE